MFTLLRIKDQENYNSLCVSLSKETIIYEETTIVFFTNPIVGSTLFLIALLEIFFSILSSYFTYKTSMFLSF